MSNLMNSEFAPLPPKDIKELLEKEQEPLDSEIVFDAGEPDEKDIEELEASGLLPDDDEDALKDN